MKNLICLFGLLSISPFLKAQDLGGYIFPKTVSGAHYTYPDRNGDDIKGREAVIMYIQKGNEVEFQRTEVFESNITGKIKRNFLITDSVIYLENEIISSEIFGRKEYDFGERNIYIKLPKDNTIVTWETKEGDTRYKCIAKKVKAQNGDHVQQSIIIERTPIENNKLLNEFKTKMIFIYGMGLFEERLSKNNNPLYSLSMLDK